MKTISTLAILVGSVNVSLLFTLYYNYNSFPPISYLLLSICLLFLILLAEYEYRRFKLLEQQSASETINIFNRYLYLFFVGSIVVLIKAIMHMNSSNLQLQYEKYMFVSCFEAQNNLYFNLLYYASNYILGKYYIHMFKALHNKFLNKQLEGTEIVIEEKMEHCQICLSKLEQGCLKTTTKCNHSFHMLCLRKWLEVKNVCPLCKQTVLREITVDDNVMG